MGDAVDTLEAVDEWAFIRNRLRELSHERGEWAGYPLPMDGSPLVVEPKFPRAKELMAIGSKAEDQDAPGVKIRNVFYSTKWRLRVRVMIWEEADGRIGWGIEPAFHQLGHALSTLGAADVWGIEQEHKAVQLLGTMLRHRQFKQYLLTGMFAERSHRSGLTYLFRRLRPTVVLSTHGDRPKIICALCLHPIAYYEGSWAGAMCPSDDVVAHLALMRGDEHMLWRRANQHPSTAPEAGI